MTSPQQNDPVMQALMEAFQFFQAGNAKRAISICEALHKENPNHPEIFNLLGIISYHTGEPKKAISNYQKAIEINPNKAEYFTNLGAAQNDLETYDDALESYEKAISLEPHSNSTRFNKAITLRTLGRIEEACDTYQEIIDSHPNTPKIQKGMSFHDMKNSFGPELAKAIYNRGLIDLRLGNYESGFADHELRWLQPGAQAIFPGFENIKMWDGTDLGNGSLLIYAEQGMGDVIQFIRYAPQISEMTGKILLKCHPPLHRLLSQLPKIEIVPPNTVPEKFSAFAPVMSLSYIFDSKTGTLPDESFLKAEASLIKKWSEHIDPGFNVGFVWGGSLDHMNEKNRSCTLRDFSIFFDLENINFYSLQVGRDTTELKSMIQKQPNLKDLGSLVSDFADTAAIIENLNLVILVDTSVAHLAGAMGKPTWVVLPFVPDWRWIKDRNDSPWYPSMKLFKQNEIGNWSEVFSRIKDELKQLI